MTTPATPRPAQEPWGTPPGLLDARCRACWFAAAVVALVVGSFWSLDLQWGNLFSAEAARAMGRFLAEFFPPDTSPAFLHKVAIGTWETLAISALGTVGLSTGITPLLSDPGKIVLIVLMLVGRLGPISAAVALSRQRTPYQPEYLEEEPLVG